MRPVAIEGDLSAKRRPPSATWTYLEHIAASIDLVRHCLIDGPDPDVLEYSGVRLLALVVVALLGSASASCVRHARVTSRTTEYGTCAGACEHYVDCRGDADARLERSCQAECQAIFVTDGEVDHEALAEFEELGCPETVAFVEGDSGRAPGAGAAATLDAATADRQRQR
jgi:hypothetical protein